MNLRTLDHKLTCLLHDRSGKRPWLDKLAIFCARDLPFVFMGLPVVVVLANEYHNPTSPGWLAAFVLCVFFFGWIITQGIAYLLQRAFARLRPFQSEHLHPIYKARIPSPSFPSGHATLVSFVLTSVGVFTLAPVFVQYEWMFWVMVGMGSVILLARVYGGLHYVSDILAGLVLGSGMFFLLVELLTVYFDVFVEPVKIL